MPMLIAAVISIPINPVTLLMMDLPYYLIIPARFFSVAVAWRDVQLRITPPEGSLLSRWAARTRRLRSIDKLGDKLGDAYFCDGFRAAILVRSTRSWSVRYL